jgi:hypothetical protein
MLVRIFTLSSFIAAPGSGCMKATTIVTRGGGTGALLVVYSDVVVHALDELFDVLVQARRVRCTAL